MYHFFTETRNFIDGKVFVSGSDYNHIKNVIRLKVGDRVVVSNPDGGAFKCHIEEFTEAEVVFEVEEPSTDNELPIRITLYQGLAKLDKFESIVQKCVELGVCRIVPVKMHRCVVKLDDKKGASKTERWQAISESAAKQSGRGIIPEVSLPISFVDAINETKANDAKIVVPYEEAEGMENLRKVLDEILNDVKNICLENSNNASGKNSQKDIAIFIGPEGGFEESEIKLAKDAGAKIVSLGKRILRTETAGPALLAAMMLEIEMRQ